MADWGEPPPTRTMLAMTRRPLRRATWALACAALLCTGAPAATAAPPQVEVVLALRPADRAALDRAVALPPQASAAERRAALAQARPTGAAKVAEYLRRNGFSVVRQDAWTVAARGRADLAHTLHHPDIEHVAGLGARRRWRHNAIPRGYTGAALRSAYDAAGNGRGVTVATVQFSGWDPFDLTTYANHAGLPDPLPTEIAVEGADPRDVSSGDHFEVALDQEILLAAAPEAAQRIYFAPNTGLGAAVALYAQIADDAEAGLVDVVSTSWGMCEPFADLDPAARDALETQFARIVAAGAPIFAASGDMGAYDCSSPARPDDTVAVDYPAASPYVVGVGGTTLTRGGIAWTERAWSRPTTSGAFRGFGGGGGQSSTVPRPEWQASLPVDGETRLVPDVASVADPNTGFGAYSSAVGGWVLGGGTSAGAPLLAGHLAAALSAAGRTVGPGQIHDELYANPRAFRDVTAGHNLRYNAVAGYDRATGLGTPRWSAVADALFGDPVVGAPVLSRSLRIPIKTAAPPGVTVVSWQAGEGAGLRCDPAGSAMPPTAVTLLAGDGLRRVAVAALDATGTCRVGTTTVVVDTRAPKATASVRAVAYDARTVFAWGATDPAPSSGVTYDVCVYALGVGCVWRRSGTTARSVTLSLSQGRTYVLRVAPRDGAGNHGATVSSARYVVPVDQAAFGRSSGWSAVSSRADWFGGHWAGTAGATLTKTLTGTRYDLVYVAHPGGGVADVYVGGVLVRRIDTYAATTAYRRVALLEAYTARAARTVRVVVRSRRVSVDAVRVAY